MFIDLVDFEYCQRSILNGYKIIKVNNVFLLHEIGNITHRKFFLWDVHVKNHSSFRKYYMSRNIVYYAKKYNKSTNLIISYIRIGKLLTITILYEDDKVDKIKAIIKGALDGGRLDVRQCLKKDESVN